MLVFVSGCATTPPSSADNRLDIDAAEYPRVMDAAVIVLRDAGFQIDQQDYRFGRVTTQPLASPLLFEFWKPRSPDPQTRLESTLNDHRRTVTVTLTPVTAVTPPAAYELTVQVLIERCQLPGKHLTGSTKNIWAAPAVVPVEWRRRGIEARYWQPVGRDTAFEEQLLAQIIRRSVSL